MLVSSKREEEYEGTHMKNCCDEITWEKILYKKDKNGAEASLSSFKAAALVVERFCNNFIFTSPTELF